MINHLKEIHRKLYLPRVPDSAKPSFKVTPIDEPYLYTDANLYVDAFDNPIQSVKVTVLNVGGGTLQVDRIQIPRTFRRWVKRGEKVTPAVLTTTSPPLEIELKFVLKELPNPSSVNVAKLPLISNAKRKGFSNVLLGVRSPEYQFPHVTVPEYINFGEITVWRVSLTGAQKDEPAQTTDFFLVGDFGVNLPRQLEVTQNDEFSFDASFLLGEGELHYNLDFRTPGVVIPRQKKGRLKLKSLPQTVSIANVNRHKFSGAVKSDVEWLAAPREIDIEPYGTTDFPISLNVEKLKPGPNFGKLGLSDKEIPVWAWYKTVGETALTLGQDQPNIHHIDEFPAKGKPMPIEVGPANERHQSFMIFEDLDFRFPLSKQDRAGYLIGDFNQWTPRTLLLEKRDDSFGVTLSIPDGTYLFRAEIDGEMRLDPGRLHEIVCCSHGLASRMQVERREQKITLRNQSRQRLKLRLQSSTEWIQVASDPVLLSANEQRDVPVVFLPKTLQPGLNLGWLEIETIGKSKRSIRAPIFVMGITNGAVPILRNPEIEFPKFEQGKGSDMPLVLDIVGKGELKGEIQPSTVLRFADKGDLRVQNKTAFETMEVEPLVQVLSDKPSNAYRKQCKASLITDCYLANRRVLPFVAKYDMVHLIAEPPMLYFPKVFLFDEQQHANIMVRRSDNGEVVECNVEIPEELAQTGLLKVKDKTNQSKTDWCEFVLDPQAVEAAGRFTGALRLKDKKSGMTLPIAFGANIVRGKGDIQIANPTQPSRQLDGVPIVITNVGKVEVRIFEVRFKAGNFYLTPQLTPNLTLLAGESLDLLVKVRKQAGFLLRTVVKDTIIIRLNDSQFRQGLFEKEIAAEVRGIF